MEKLFNILQRVIAEGIPELRLTDEDYGQLETQEDHYPVTFPCVLLAVPEVAWTELAGGAQRGTATVITRLAVDCYHDTHHGSGTEEETARRQQMRTRLHRLLQGRKPLFGCGALVRRKSRDYSLPGGIKVYETEYELAVADTPGTVSRR